MGFRQPAGAVGGLGVRALGLIVAVLGWGISLFSGTVSVSAADNAVNHEQQYREQLVPLLVTYCKDCHVGMDAEGGFNLQRSPSAASLLKNRKDWLRALTQVQGKVMPPQDGPAMDDATRGRMTKLIDELANAADCIANPNAGKVVMRRLTRTEYRNTIRDLVGIDYEPAASFPADDIGYGFDNIGDVLTLPPLLLEKYLKAAEEITQQAIQTPPPLEVYERSWGGTQLKADKGGNANGGTFVLASAGTAVIEDRMPFAGNYTLTVTASGDQAGPDPCEMMIVVGDKELDKIKVPNKDEKDYVVQLKLPAGPRKIGIRFTNDFYKAAEGGNKAQDRNLRIHYVKLEGAHRQAAILDGRKAPPTHDKLLFVKPTDKISADQATRQVIERFASRAFRRPAKPDEVERLMKLAQSVREADGSFEEGVQVAMQAVLVTPSFLYKIENPPVKPGVMAVPLTDYELATRLSYFLWNSMPDDALLLDAWKGRLKDPQVLESHVQRMLRDVRSNAFIENFGGQWLQLRSLERVSPDPKLFPKFTDSIRSSLKKETLYFVTAVLREDLPVTAMLDGEFTFLNQELAEYYGINGVTGKEFRPVSLKGTGRGGLLTQGSILIVTSNPSRTSPVKRGKWILDNLLGTPPPPAPPDVPQLEKVKLTGTLREQMEQHRVNPACASCHKLMDPLGFALEHFDAVGRVRTQDRGAAIDASGELPDGTKFTGVVQLRQILARERLDLFVRCLSEKMLTYALGRGLEYYDKCAIDEIVRKAEADKLRMSTLITAIVLSEPFRKQGARE